LIKDTGGILTGTRVNNCINQDLDGVGVSEQVDDLESTAKDADSQQLLSVVTSVHHEGIGHTLNNGALCLPEPLLVVTTEGVWEVGLVLVFLGDCNVILEGRELSVYFVV
jgi:hypothetical protein